MQKKLRTLLSIVGLLFSTSTQVQAVATNPSWVSNAVIYEVNVRQFSADSQLSSVTKAIPRLKALGVTVIWLMPIHPIGKDRAAGVLGSPYAVADYRAVNPEFGTAADLTELVNTVHANHMHIILDWVANHTAWDNPWVSQHPDWYSQRNGEIISPPNTNWLDVADLNYSNQAMRTEMISAMAYWVNNFGVDGFRCDAAGMVPQDFWEQARTELNKSNNLFMLAEDDSNFGLLDSAFNANYNWRLRDTLKSLATGFGSKEELVAQQQVQEFSYPAGTYPMNFITNHDDNSWNGTTKAIYGGYQDAMTVLSYTLPGIPLIYNGQEIGLNRQLKFFEKDPINWVADRNQSASQTALFMNLNSLKKNNPALNSAGTNYPQFLNSGNANVIEFVRTSGKNKVLVLVNLSAKARTAKITIRGSLYALGSKKLTILPAKTTLKAKGFMVYSTKP
jgi:glycosidase